MLLSWPWPTLCDNTEANVSVEDLFHFVYSAAWWTIYLQKAEAKGTCSKHLKEKEKKSLISFHLCVTKQLDWDRTSSKQYHDLPMRSKI